MLIATFEEVVGKPFQAHKFIFESPKLSNSKLLFEKLPFEKLKIQASHFWLSHSFMFYYKGVYNKRGLKYTETGPFLLINLRLLFA